MCDPAWLHWLDTCESTNTWAMTHLHQLSHGAVVYTPLQTAGRGQWGRNWIAPRGVLTASFILRGVAPEYLGYLSLLTGLQLVRILVNMWPDLDQRLHLKWPNDVWLDRRKLAGILSESRASSGDRSTIVVGIGLNYAADFRCTELRDRAISLDAVISMLPTPWHFLASLRASLLELVSQLKMLPPNARLSPRWVHAINQRDLLRDRTVTAWLGTEVITGVGLGIDWQGGYQLRLADGTIRSLTTGQIQHWQ